MSETELSVKGPFVGVPLIELSEPATRERGPLMVEQLRAVELRLIKQMQALAEMLYAKQVQRDSDLRAMMGEDMAQQQRRGEAFERQFAMMDQQSKELLRLAEERLRDEIDASERRISKQLMDEGAVLRKHLMRIEEDAYRRSALGRWRRFMAWVKEIFHAR